MMLTMYLAGRLIEQLYLHNGGLSIIGRIDGAMNELKEDYEEMISQSKEQPLFVLTDYRKMVEFSFN